MVLLRATWSGSERGEGGDVDVDERDRTTVEGWDQTGEGGGRRRVATLQCYLRD